MNTLEQVLYEMLCETLDEIRAALGVEDGTVPEIATRVKENCTQLAALSWAQWISVEERLPVWGDVVIVSYGGIIDIGYFDGLHWFVNGLIRFPVFWMPLPPAPEQVNK